ncbi:hypothetical protein SALBM311S_07849 [Streptomyces alboniger]
MRAGDIVLVRTGQVQVYLAGDKEAYGYPSPGLSIRTPEWFHARDVAAVANDTLTFEVFPPEIEDLWLPVHALDLVEMGMLQGQNWNLEELSTACGQGPVHVPAVRDARTLRRRDRNPGGTRRDPLRTVGWRCATPAPSTASRTAIRLRRTRPGSPGPEGTDAESRPTLVEGPRHRSPRRPLAVNR